MVATDTAFVPFEFKQGNTYTGFDIDLWAAIAKELNLKYKLQPMDFNGIIPACRPRTSMRRLPASRSGTTARRSSTSPIPTMRAAWPSWSARRTTASREAKGPLRQERGRQDRHRHGRLHEVAGARRQLKLFPNIDNAYLELATGRVDAAVHDTPNVQYYANTAGKGRVKVVGTVKSGDFYGIAFPKGSELVPQVNKALATLKANGQYDAIYTKWFGKQP